MRIRMERTCRCDVRYLVELYTNLASESAVTASCSSNGFKNRKEDWFVEQNEDWKPLCESSLLKNHLPVLEKIYQNDFNSNDTEFLNSYLKPFVVLLDSIRSAIQVHYSQIEGDTAETSWIGRFEAIVRYVIQPKPLKLSLHKGDFYVHLSSTLPRKLQLKFFDSGTLQSRTLSTDDCIYMCSEDWTDNLRKEAKSRFVYSNCIVWSKKKTLERKQWRNILTQTGQTEELKTQMSLERADSVVVDLEARGKLLAELEEKPLHILELDFEMLHSQITYLPGTRDKRGGAVIVIHSFGGCWDNLEVSSIELAKLFMYYYKIPRIDVQKLGCSLVIDARQGKQVRYILECIGEAIELFQITVYNVWLEKVPSAVHMAYVITRKDSLLLLIGAGKMREKLNFEFQLISNLQKLYQEIEQEQLPVELGGGLVYCHEKWIKFRTHLEPFMISCRSAAKHAMASIKELAEVKLGSTTDECRTLIDQHRGVIKSVLEDSRLTNLREEGKKILERLSVPVVDIPRTMDYEDTEECVHKLYDQMDSLFEKFQKFSARKTKKLETQLQMCLFDEESEKILNWLENEGMPFLEAHTDIGDSIGHVTSLQVDFAHFEKMVEENTSDAGHMVEVGKSLNNSRDLDGKEMSWIKDRVENLENQHDVFSMKLDSRKKKLSQGMEFYHLFEKASDWSLQCLRYIAQMNMEDLQTSEGVQKLREELEHFLDENKPLEEKEMARMTELAHHLESEKLKMQAGQISGRCSEVDEMIKKKFKTVKAAEDRLQAAVSCGSSESSGICKDDDLATECGEDVKEHDDSMGPMFSWKNDSERGYDENDDILVAFDALISPKLKEKLRYIAEEMINTEKDYVSSLEYILKNYIPEMEKPSLPPTLIGKKNILFGNIERIYDFHKRYFSQELENYMHSPLQVGKCFLRWERQFYLYALYNKNKPKSDSLLNDFGNAHFVTCLKYLTSNMIQETSESKEMSRISFLKTKQNELKDKLNLASYLIKPVQRLGKYALLLRDMANCCSSNDPRLGDLQAAQDMIKFQLRHGNDLLAMDSIRECDVHLRSQGCLLRQGDFIVYSNKKKHLRRVFLFEDLILFSKAKKQVVQGDCFISKSSLKTADLGLTENVGEKGHRFEVWYRRWRKSKKTESYILQASSIEIKKAWVNDIRRILLNQSLRNKEYSRSEMTTGISVESQPSGLYSENAVGYTSSTHMYRPRMDPAQRHDAQPSTQPKRLSWISAESATTSGIHDMNSNTENDVTRNEETKREEIRQSVASTKQRQSSLQKSQDPEFFKDSDTANALVDLPFKPIKTRDAVTDSEFVRNTLHRRTLHVDFATDGKGGSSPKLPAGRTVSSPVTDNTVVDKQKSPTAQDSFSEADEIDACDYENMTEKDRLEGPNTRRDHSMSLVSMSSLQSPLSPTSSLQSSSPCLLTSTPEPPVSPSATARFTFPGQKKDTAQSKEKTKEKRKKHGRKISLSNLMGRKKKTSSTSSEGHADDK